MSRIAIAWLLLAGALGVPPLEAASLQLPQTTRATLDNGLQVIIMPTKRLPLVDLALMVRAGAVNDPRGKEGLANLTADLLTQGAGKRDARAIAEAIDFVGGSLSSSASPEQLVVLCEVLKKDFDTGLELLRDVVVHPAFPPAEFDRKKDETLGSLAAMKDDPGTLASVEMLPFLMGESPLAHPPIGWEKSVAAITRDDVVAFHRDHLVPDHAVLVVVGDVEPRATLAALSKAFAGWARSGRARSAAYGAIVNGGRRVRVVSKPEVTQSQIRLGCPAVPRSHPDYYPLRVANVILGGGFTSRLVDEIRVNQGLTYSIGSNFGHFAHAGTFTVSTFTRNETLRKTIDETLKTIQQLVDEGPTQEELEKGKRYITGLFPLGLQAPDALAGQLLDIEFHGLPADYLQTFSEKIEAVTMDDVRRVLRERFCVADLKILVVSNPELARKALQGLGPIEVKQID